MRITSILILMKTLIYVANNQIEAHLTKGYLENHGIKAVISPGNDTLSSMGSGSPNINGVSHSIFVSDADFEEAKRILEERDSYNQSSQE